MVITETKLQDTMLTLTNVLFSIVIYLIKYSAGK